MGHGPTYLDMTKAIVSLYIGLAFCAFVLTLSAGMVPNLGEELAFDPGLSWHVRSALFLFMPLAFFAATKTWPKSVLGWGVFCLLSVAMSLSLPGYVIGLLALLIAVTMCPAKDNAGSHPEDVATRSRALFATVIAMVAFGVVLRLFSFNEPMGRDLAVYAMVSSGWLEGLALYDEVWDHKPPALYVVYAAAIAVFGQSPIAIYAMNVAFFAITLVGAAIAARKLAGDHAAIIAAVLFGIMGSDPLVEINQPNVEHFLNAALIWSLVLLLPVLQAPPTWVRTCLVGLLFFAGSAFKQLVVFPSFTAVLALLIVGLRNQPLHWCARVGVIGIIGVAGWAAIALAFYAGGTFDSFYYAVFGYNQDYAGSLWFNLERTLRRGNLPFYFFVFLLFGAYHLMRGRETNHLLMAAFYLGVLTMFWTPGKFYDHYYQLFLPLIAVSAGVMIAQRYAGRPIWLLSVIAVAPIMVSFGYMTSPERLAYVKHGRDAHGGETVESRAVGQWLAAEGYDMSKVLHWGAEPGIYFWSGQPTSFKYVFNYPLLNGSRQEAMTKEFIAQVRCEAPTLVVVKRADRNVNNAALAYLQTYYKPAPGYPVYQVFEFWEPRAGLPPCDAS